ncbi:MAG TPA: hypothetical protein VG815_07975 [Chloroflexota bacterium]|jgi:hypothetical protein|nr:hypothetical protein [Chloroflexota bacterium]
MSTNTPMSAEELTELRGWIEAVHQADLSAEAAISAEGVLRLIATVDRAKLNTRRMALLAETFVYEPQRLTEGGLLAQVQRALTDQDVGYQGKAEEGRG